VSNFIVKALRGEPLEIYGDGLQTRSFCYVDDLIRGLVSFMDLEGDFPGPVNLGNPTEFTILQLAETIRSKLGTRAQIIFRPLPADDPRQRRPDITLARDMLGWTPTVALDEGLARTIAYFEELLGRA